MQENLEFHLGRALYAMDRMEACLLNVTEEEFLSSDLMIDAMSTNLLRVNMAYKMITKYHPHLLVEHPDLDWEGVENISTKLIDEFMDVDNSWVWKAAALAMPIQKRKLTQKFGPVVRQD